MQGQWRVLSRPECSLCEEMLSELVELLGPQAAQQVQVQDITDNPSLERRYGHRIPVLLIDDEFVCAYRLDHSRLTGYLPPDPAQ
jgi:hypothetical protein